MSQEELREDDAPQVGEGPENAGDEPCAPAEDQVPEAKDPLAALQAELEAERRRAELSTLGWATRARRLQQRAQAL